MVEQRILEVAVWHYCKYVLNNFILWNLHICWFCHYVKSIEDTTECCIKSEHMLITDHYVVRGKAMFSHVCVILFGGGGESQTMSHLPPPRRDLFPQTMSHLTHPSPQTITYDKPQPPDLYPPPARASLEWSASPGWVVPDMPRNANARSSLLTTCLLVAILELISEIWNVQDCCINEYGYFCLQTIFWLKWTFQMVVHSICNLERFKGSNGVEPSPHRVRVILLGFLWYPVDGVDGVSVDPLVHVLLQFYFKIWLFMLKVYRKDDLLFVLCYRSFELYHYFRDF